MSAERLAERLADLRAAVARLSEALEGWRTTEDDVYRDSMVKRFEFTFELSWKAMRDWLRVWETDVNPLGPRQIFEAAFARGLIDDANLWSAMLVDRNLTVHVYDEEQVNDIATGILERGMGVFDNLVARIERGG